MAQDESTIIVTPEALKTALRVWIVTAPKRMWRDYWTHSETEAKWRGGSDPFDRFDPRHALAEYLAGKVTQAGWTVTHAEPKAPGSPPAWRAPADE